MHKPEYTVDDFSSDVIIAANGIPPAGWLVGNLNKAVLNLSREEVTSQYTIPAACGRLACALAINGVQRLKQKVDFVLASDV